MRDCRDGHLGFHELVAGPLDAGLAQLAVDGGKSSRSARPGEILLLQPRRVAARAAAATGRTPADIRAAVLRSAGFE